MKYLVLTFVAVLIFVLQLSAQFASEMIKYHPAPGQLINTDGAGSFEAAGSIVGSIDGMVSLGSFGGNIVLKFDQPVKNDPDNPYGIDFVIFGNPQLDWAEPGIVMVMKDENKNGKADDTWYELAGSDYSFSTTDHNFSVTYYNPGSSVSDDVSWVTSDLRSGSIFSNSFHKQDYYPSAEFYDEDISEKISFSGTRISDQIDFSIPALIKSYQRKFGYADNIIRKNSNFSLPDNPYTTEIEGCGGDAMDIGWAVDENGNYINLNQIDFVKIYNGVLANAGWMGEVSTEICGIADVPANATLSGAEKCLVINYLPRKLFSGSIFQLEAKAFRNGKILNGEKINWSVDNGQVASVNADDLLELKKNGALKITASLLTDPTVTTSLNVEIVSPATIEIVLESNTIRVDEEAEIKATVKDGSQNILSNVEIEWIVNDNDVLSLSESGGKYFIKGLREGICPVEVHLKNKPDLKSVINVSVLSESSQKQVFVTIKDQNSTFIPRDKIEVKNFNLNPYVDQARGDYGIQNVSGITVAHAITQVFINSGFSEDFRFRDDERGGDSLYIWKVPKGDPSNVEYIYGYGGSTSSLSFSKSWIVLLNNEQIISGFDRQYVKNGDELIVYHIPDVSNEWKVTCFVANKNEISVEDTIAVYSSELTCNKNEDGKILIKSSSPLQNQMIWVNDQAAYFNGDRVATDETGMATLRFNQPGIKSITSGIDEMVISVKQTTSITPTNRGLDIRIWPQPAKGLLNISVFNQQISSLKIFDSSGRFICVENVLDLGHYSLKTDEIVPGIYILQICTDKGVSNHKIILQ